MRKKEKKNEFSRKKYSLKAQANSRAVRYKPKLRANIKEDCDFNDQKRRFNPKQRQTHGKKCELNIRPTDGAIRGGTLTSQAEGVNTGSVYEVGLQPCPQLADQTDK